MEVPTLSKNKILQGLFVLAILVCGYFLFLLLGIEVVKQEEFYFVVLSLGVLVIFVICSVVGGLSILHGHDFVNTPYTGTVLSATIIVSAFFIFLIYLRIFCLSLNIWLLIFFFPSVITVSYIYYVIVRPKKDEEALRIKNLLKITENYNIKKLKISDIEIEFEKDGKKYYKSYTKRR